MEDLVDEGVAARIGKVVGDDEVLEALEQLHCKEEEDARREAEVAGARVDPPGGEEPDGGEAERAALREAHDDLRAC